MDLKKPLTFDEQLDKLVSHGIVIADREKAKDILKRVNYYRFTGYALQIRQTVIDRLKAYFDKFYGVGGAAKFTKDSDEN